ncbi:hypothetical protein [Parasitella parasitica]|uniref:Uncharacterized protein n=1 Tax=Parasitella parasitica TaxID=35722 RepID=A0A0B7NQ54_9FUNG|nr:hypothetical protein [Parasitella parasitica]
MATFLTLAMSEMRAALYSVSANKECISERPAHTIDNPIDAKNLAIDKPDNHFDVPQTNTESESGIGNTINKRYYISSTLFNIYIELEDSGIGSQVRSGFAQKNVIMQASSKERRKGKDRATSFLDYLTESEIVSRSIHCLGSVYLVMMATLKRVRQRSSTYSSEENSLHRRDEGMDSEIIVDGTPAPHSFDFGRRGRGRTRKNLPTKPLNIPKISRVDQERLT